jgi:hypothetical protein
MARVVVPSKEEMTQFKVIPPGLYRARITKCEPAVSKAQNPCLSIIFTILSEGPNPEANAMGTLVPDKPALTNEAMWRINQLYEAITGTAIPKGEYDSAELQQLIRAAIVNQEVNITTQIDTNREPHATRITGYGSPQA